MNLLFKTTSWSRSKVCMRVWAPLLFLWRCLIICWIYRKPMYPPLGCTPLGVLGLEIPLPARWLWTSLYVMYLPKATVKLWESVTNWKLISTVIKITLTIKNLRCSNILMYNNVKWIREGEELLDHVLHSLYIIKKNPTNQPTNQKTPPPKHKIRNCWKENGVQNITRTLFLQTCGSH